ncbi:MAG: TolC family protein, partial [Candidatus Binatia bacterium]
DLTACVRFALAHNPDLADAADSSVSAALGREVPLAEYNLKLVPAVSGGLQGANNTNQRYEMRLQRKLLPVGTQIGVSGGTSVFSSVPQASIPYFTESRLTVSQPLWQGRTRLENSERIDDANRRVAAAEHALVTAREELILQVVRGFYEVVRGEELVSIAEVALGRVRELGQIADAKLSLGTVSKMDVFRTDLHAARLKNALVEQQARREAALDTLKGLLGLGAELPLTLDARVAAGAAGLAPPPGTRVEDEIEAALERRIELREAKAQVTDAERKALLASYKIWPAVNLVGSYAKQGLGNSFEESSRLRRTEWLVGLSSTTPLDRTEERVAASQAEITLRGRERQYRALRDQLTRQVRDAWRQLERARAERALAAEIVAQSEKQAELARFRYDKGITDNFDLVQAETDLAEAKSGNVLAAIEELLAGAQVRRSAGTLAESFGIADEPGH